jgi:outer membrane protein
MKIKVLFLSIFLLTTAYSLFAETYTLNLEESIGIAKMRSYDMLSLKQDLKIAEYNLRSTTSELRTHVDLSLTTPEYTETISQYEDTAGISFYSVKQLYSQGYLTVNQPLPTDGNLYLRTYLANTDDYNDNQRSMKMYTRIGITQPIDALYGYNSIQSSYKKAKLAYEKSQRQLKREELNLIYEVSDAFYGLLSVQKQQDIAKMNLDRQTEAYKIAKNKYEAGLIREVDALQMEVDLAEAQNNYDLAVVNQTSSMNYFKELIGLNLKDSVTLSSKLEYKPIIVDPEKAVEMALQNRSEIREQEIAIELNKISIKKQKAEGMISGDVTAYYEKAGISKQELGKSLSSSINNSFTDLQNRPQNYGVGLTINIPIVDWGENRALVKAAEAEMQQSLYEQEATKRSIEREVRNLVDDLNSNLKRLQLLEKNIKVAEKSFEITKARFADGDIDSQALALERERLNTAYTSHLSAYIDYQLNLANLMRKTFYDFQNDRMITD